MPNLKLRGVLSPVKFLWTLKDLVYTCLESLGLDPMPRRHKKLVVLEKLLLVGFFSPPEDFCNPQVDPIAFVAVILALGERV